MVKWNSDTQIINLGKFSSSINKTVMETFWGPNLIFFAGIVNLGSTPPVTQVFIVGDVGYKNLPY